MVVGRLPTCFAFHQNSIAGLVQSGVFGIGENDQIARVVGPACGPGLDMVNGEKV